MSTYQATGTRGWVGTGILWEAWELADASLHPNSPEGLTGLPFHHPETLQEHTDRSSIAEFCFFSSFKKYIQKEKLEKRGWMKDTKNYPQSYLPVVSFLMYAMRDS